MFLNNKKIKNVPLVLQLQPVECSAASLAMILAYYGKWVPLEELRYYCSVTRNGSNVLNIVEAAEYYGLKAKCFRRGLESLMHEATLPCIIHWNFAHFVVLCGFKGDNAIINDPARGKVVVKRQELGMSFTGIVLEFEKGESFVESGKKPSIFAIVTRKLLEAKNVLFISFITSLVGAFIGLLKPALEREFIDKVLDTVTFPIKHIYLSLLITDKESLIFITAIIIFFIIELISIYINENINLKVSASQATKANADFMQKVLSIPFKFFNERDVGDIHQRKSVATTLIIDLINSFIPYIFKVLMSVFYLIVMLFYSPLLGAFGLLSILISVFLSNYVAEKQVDCQRVAAIDNAILYSSTVSGVEMIETIKKGGNEESYMGNWIGAFNKCQNSMKTIMEMDINYNFIPAVTSILVNSIMMYLGVMYILNGNWTIGMVIAFQGFYNNCTQSIFGAIDDYKTMSKTIPNIERINDVIDYKDEKVFLENKDTSLEKFKGTIEVKNLNYSYEPFSDMLLKDINFSIKEGEKVAIVGRSGCGKSTFAKLIMGMYEPISGTVLYDGKKINEISKYEFYSSIQYVDINTLFFNDTIENNLKMWDETVENFELQLAIKDAEIRDSISKKEKGLSYICREGAKEFSGGEKQRLELARAIAIDPNIMILDEATNAIDLVTEKKILDALDKRGITTIFITHRYSIMERCDRILIMEGGKIVEEGTHNELLQNSKRYNELIIRG